MKQATEIPFRQLFESAPGLFLVLKPDFTIVAVSNAYLEATMTKRETILDHHLFEIFPDNPDDPAATGVSNLRSSLNFVLQNKLAHTMAVQQYDIRRPDGSFEERFWSPLNTPVCNDRNEIVYIIHRVEDVTEFVRMQADQEKQQELNDKLHRRLDEMQREIYKRAQEIQRLNSTLQQQVDEKTMEIKNIFARITDGFMALDNQSRVTYINKKTASVIGLPEQEVLGKRIDELYSAEIWDHTLSDACREAITRQEPCATEIYSKVKDRWLEIDLYPSSSGISLFFRDISEKKKNEEQLRQSHEQLRQLASHLQNIREEEQKRIAREVHDELGQQITGLKMDVSWIQKRLSGQEESAALDGRLTQMTNLLDEAALTVRKISSELRPAILDDFGLITALEWQSEEFEKRFSIPVLFSAGTDYIEIPSPLATGLFRTYQESLTNIARHANAKQVLSSLQVADGEIILTVSDNGKGFDTRTNGQRKTLGLLGMKERVLMMDGNLEIRSEPGRGTTITIKVPLKR
jgi:PAS domain S-box-containing protein